MRRLLHRAVLAGTLLASAGLAPAQSWFFNCDFETTTPVLPRHLAMTPNNPDFGLGMRMHADDFRHHDLTVLARRH